LKRDDKYDYLYNNDLQTVAWKRLEMSEPYYWFVDKDFTHHVQYDKGWKITDIFDVFSSGIETKIDPISIDFERDKIEKRVKDILENKLTLAEIIKKFNISNKTSWEYKRAIKSKFQANEITNYHYRPFDFRFIFYNTNFISRSRQNVMDNFFEKENLGLVFPRIAKGYKSNYGFITNSVSDRALGGSRSGSETYIAPLYVYKPNKNHDENGNGFLFTDDDKKDNFTVEFRKYLKENQLDKYSPEQILGYVYAILFSPTYREKYFEFLKIDFPKIPFTDNLQDFKNLSALGCELIEHHLLKRNYQKNEMPIYAVDGNNEVKQIQYNPEQKRLYINKIQYFENFPQSVWEYEIGGYQVFDKYLKSRKDLSLTYNEINHLKKVAASLLKTLEIQQDIDYLCTKWV